MEAAVLGLLVLSAVVLCIYDRRCMTERTLSPEEQ